MAAYIFRRGRLDGDAEVKPVTQAVFVEVGFKSGAARECQELLHQRLRVRVSQPSQPNYPSHGTLELALCP